MEVVLPQSLQEYLEQEERLVPLEREVQVELMASAVPGEAAEMAAALQEIPAMIVEL